MEKITQCLIFPELFSKPIHVKFNERDSSSDGGALLLKAADQKLQLTSALAACLVDERQAAKVKHTIEDLLRQRIYGLASGYADANDAARLAHDPVFKLLLDREPLDGPELSSQPTLSRFENRIGPRENYRLGWAQAQAIINRHRRRRRRQAKCVTIDLDTTDDPTHGQQEFTFFHTHYDSYCYLTLLAFISFDDEPEQYLVTALLRPSKVTEKSPVVLGLLKVFSASEQLFHTGWFVESLATQTLVIFIIRTAGNPFRSRPSLALSVTTIAVVMAGIVIPSTSLGRILGFTPLPPAFFFFLAGATATYLLLVEIVKRKLMLRLLS